MVHCEFQSDKNGSDEAKRVNKRGKSVKEASFEVRSGNFVS